TGSAEPGQQDGTRKLPYHVLQGTPVSDSSEHQTTNRSPDVGARGRVPLRLRLRGSSPFLSGCAFEEVPLVELGGGEFANAGAGHFEHAVGDAADHLAIVGHEDGRALESLE